MRLDQTHIAIRRRSLLEICDLSIHVLRDHILAIIVLLIIGITPWILLNYFLIGWMISEDYAGQPQMALLYWWVMFLLVCAQSQVGTMFVTKYLGDATFQLRPKIWTTVGTVLRSFPSLLTLHFLVRPLIFVLACGLLFLPRDFNLIGFAAFLFLPSIVLLLMLIRAFRPFVNEIVLLEKTPLKESRAGQVTYAVRTKSLHSLDGGNIFGRSLGIWLAAIPMFFVFTGAVLAVKFIVTLGADMPWLTQALLIPASIWLTAGLVSVIRFLTYIDTRIYQEGWDIELKIRAEAMKLKERLS